MANTGISLSNEFIIFFEKFLNIDSKAIGLILSLCCINADALGVSADASNKSNNSLVRLLPVSYTHLDVYKRQHQHLYNREIRLDL